jgi:hypothetical protein
MAEILAISREKWILILQEIEDLLRILYCILESRILTLKACLRGNNER